MALTDAPSGRRHRTAKKVRGRRRKKPVARPPTFEEVRAANLKDPFHAARIARLNSGEHFDDPTANSEDQWEREVFVHPDCEGGSHWFVEWGDSDGGCYVTTFDGPMAEQIARDYFDVLKAGRLKILRETWWRDGYGGVLWRRDNARGCLHRWIGIQSCSLDPRRSLQSV
jgi:hypothetical protein